MGDHLVPASVAGAIEALEAGRVGGVELRVRHEYIGVDRQQPQALDRLDQVSGVDQLRAFGEGFAELGFASSLVGAARAFGADFEFAALAARLRQRRLIRVLAGVVLAERGFPQQVGLVRHEAEFAHLDHQAFGALLHDLVGADHRRVLGQARRIAGGVDFLLLAVLGQKVVLARFVVVERLDGVVVAGRDEKAHALGLVLLHDLGDAVDVHRLGVVGIVARQRDDANALGVGVVERGVEGEVIFVEQARGGQLRIHRADGRVPAVLGWNAGKLAALEVAVDILEVDVAHEGDGGAHRGRLWCRRLYRRRDGDRRIAVAGTAACQHGQQGKRRAGGGAVMHWTGHAITPVNKMPGG